MLSQKKKLAELQLALCNTAKERDFLLKELTQLQRENTLLRAQLAMEEKIGDSPSLRRWSLNDFISDR